MFFSFQHPLSVVFPGSHHRTPCGSTTRWMVISGVNRDAHSAWCRSRSTGCSSTTAGAYCSRTRREIAGETLRCLSFAVHKIVVTRSFWSFFFCYNLCEGNKKQFFFQKAKSKRFCNNYALRFCVLVWEIVPLKGALPNPPSFRKYKESSNKK